MKTRFLTAAPPTVRLLALAALVAAVMLAFGSSARADDAAPQATTPACTKSWTGNGTGGWFDPLNWSPGGVPSASDDVCIEAPSFNIVGITNAAVAHSLTIGTSSSPVIQIGGTCCRRPDSTSRNGFATDF